MTDEEKKLTGWRSFAWAVFAVVIIVFANQFIELNYYVVAPGGANPVNQAIQLPAEHDIEPNGKMLYTTVALIRAHPFDIVWSQFNSDDEIRPLKQVIGDETPKEYLASNNDAMQVSTQIATAVAMRKAGYDVSEDGQGVAVLKVSDDAPAHGVLQVGEVITDVDGHSLKTASDLGDAIGGLPIGTEITLTIKGNDAKTRTVKLKTAEHPEVKGRSYIGISPGTDKPKLITPFDVKLDLGDVGGPSAGLAMTIALLDKLTEGELTGGGQVAATGTMSVDGTIGEIGGIKQKVAAVRDDSRTKMFLVPFSEADLARRYAGKNLKIVGVRNLDEALDALAAAGGQQPGPKK